MAAPTFQTTSNSGWSTSTSSVVTKPTGVAVGDLLIACWAYATDASPNAPGGWTAIRTTTGALEMAVYRKTADASDVSATDYTFSTVNSRIQIASVTRISGQGAGNFFTDNGTAVNNTATPTATGLTPVNRADSNLLLQFWVSSTATTAIGTYAIATDNPSWTEAYDVANGTDDDFSMAYATRSQQTATGNITCAGGGGTTDWVNITLAIAPNWSTTISESVTLTETHRESFVMPINETVTLTESVTTPKSRLWSTDDKPSTTWSNTEDK